MIQFDSKRAQRLLKLRQEGAAFQWGYLLKSARLWLAVVAIACLVTYTLVRENGLLINRAVWLLAGILIGRVLRDWIWLRDVVDAFPFLDKVLDWKQVQELAGGPGTDRISG